MKRKRKRQISIETATRKICSLERQLVWHREALHYAVKDRELLAKLSARTPQFFNPLVVVEAEGVRDSVLRHGSCWGLTREQRAESKL